MTPNCPPSSSITRTSRARIRSLMRIRSACRKFLSAIKPPRKKKGTRRTGRTPCLQQVPTGQSKEGRTSNYSTLRRWSKGWVNDNRAIFLRGGESGVDVEIAFWPRNYGVKSGSFGFLDRQVEVQLLECCGE